jgi:ribonucleoside-diphosphate reductase alpha chain
VCRPFSRRARLDLDALADASAVAVRMLDDVISVSRFPLPAQARAARGARRMGLGITGLADALILLGLRYDSDAGRAAAARAMSCVCRAAYRASIRLARERGHFPWWQAEPYLDAPFLRALPSDIRDGIARGGIRNSHLTAIAPCGTISLLANNVSSGIEPVLALEARRAVRGADGVARIHRVTDQALALYRRLHGGASLPSTFVTAAELAPADHLAMQAALSPAVDNAISKTINLPAACSFEDFASVFEQAQRLGLKGCTAFRPGPLRGAVLAASASGIQCAGADTAPHCCPAERGCD